MAYGTDDYAFNFQSAVRRGDIFCRVRSGGTMPGSANIFVGFTKVGLRVGIFFGLSTVNLHVAGVNAQVNALAADFHVYHLQFHLDAGGFPVATLRADVGNQAKLTGTIAFAPTDAEFFVSADAVHNATLEADYFRFLAGSHGMNRVPRVA